jgi:hypothetical protein
VQRRCTVHLRQHESDFAFVLAAINYQQQCAAAGEPLSQAKSQGRDRCVLTDKKKTRLVNLPDA